LIAFYYQYVAERNCLTRVRGTVPYINSGREPAKFSAKADEFIYGREDWSNGNAAANIIAKQQECLSVNYIDGSMFAWPTTGFSTYLIHFPEGQIPQIWIQLWSDKFNSWQDILAVQGCIYYEAFGDIHHTSFCYFYDSRISDANHLNICNLVDRI
jgi:hypothetical protein